MRKKLTRPQIEEIVRAKLKDKLNEESYTDGTHVPGTSYTRGEIESGTQLPFQQRLAAKDAEAAAAPGPEAAASRPAGGMPAAMSALGYSPKAGYPNPDIPPGDRPGSAYAGSGVVPPEASPETGAPAPIGGPPLTPPVGGSPAIKSLYGGKEEGDIYDYFDVQPPGYVGEEGQPLTIPPGNRDIPVMPPLREGESMDEGVGMYLMNKTGAISDSDYKNYKKEQQMKKRDKTNLGTSADDIKQGTGRARQFSQIDSGGTTESQLREFVRSKLTQILDPANRKKVSESIFAPNHYCVHHGGVYLNGKVHMAEAVNHKYNKKLGKVTHYDMRLSNGRILENVPAEAIQITNASLAEDHDGHPAKRDEESEDKAAKKAMKTEGSGDRNDDDREQGHGKQRQKAGSDGKKGKLEEDETSWLDPETGQIKDPVTPRKAKRQAGADRARGKVKGWTQAAANTPPSRAISALATGVKKGAGAIGQHLASTPPMNIEIPDDVTFEESKQVSDKEWYDSQLFEALSRKWAK